MLQSNNHNHANYSKVFGNGARRWGNNEILQWLNTFLRLDSTDARSEPLNDLKETNGGCYIIQVLDAIYPGHFQLRSCIWGKRNDLLQYEVEINYRAINSGLQNTEVVHAMNVYELVEGKAGRVLEFMQWLRNLYSLREHEFRCQQYDAPARRATFKQSKLSIVELRGLRRYVGHSNNLLSPRNVNIINNVRRNGALKRAVSTRESQYVGTNQFSPEIHMEALNKISFESIKSFGSKSHDCRNDANLIKLNEKSIIRHEQAKDYFSHAFQVHEDQSTRKLIQNLSSDTKDILPSIPICFFVAKANSQVSALQDIDKDMLEKLILPTLQLARSKIPFGGSPNILEENISKIEVIIYTSNDCNATEKNNDKISKVANKERFRKHAAVHDSAISNISVKTIESIINKAVANSINKKVPNKDNTPSTGCLSKTSCNNHITKTNEQDETNGKNARNEYLREKMPKSSVSASISKFFDKKQKDISISKKLSGGAAQPVTSPKKH